jgi:hypothetical protein
MAIKGQGMIVWRSLRLKLIINSQIVVKALDRVVRIGLTLLTRQLLTCAREIVVHLCITFVEEAIIIMNPNSSHFNKIVPVLFSGL